jgi:hypothetical protein
LMLFFNAVGPPQFAASGLPNPDMIQYNTEAYFNAAEDT